MHVHAQGVKKKLDLGIAGGSVGEQGVEGLEEVAGGVFDALGGADVGGEVQEFVDEGAEVFVGNAGEEMSARALSTAVAGDRTDGSAGNGVPFKGASSRAGACLY